MLNNQQNMPLSTHTSRNIKNISDTINKVILGKEKSVRLALTCLIARGHLLIEDLPGVGKTMLVNTLAKVIGLDYGRVQFTSDLLPADILGASIFNRNSHVFEFRPGPIFTQILLADEINRATPRTQSALLEAMAEAQVTTEGETRSLPKPFFVIATQNPSQQVGVFPLPESQLDRFLMRIELGYPDRESERNLLQGEDRKHMLSKISAVIDPAVLCEMQDAAEALHVSPNLLDYIQALLQASRQNDVHQSGLSPRAGLAILQSARAWALLHQHDYVLPDDVQAILPAVINHRLLSNEQGTLDSASLLLEQVSIS